MKNHGRSPQGTRLGGKIRWLAGMLALGMVFALGGCEKIRAVMEKAAKSAEEDEAAMEEEFARLELEILDELDELEAAQEGRMSVVAGGGTEIRQVSGGEFDAFVGREGRLVVVDFYADWCGPCRVLAPTLEKVCRELGPRVSLGKVNIDREKELAGRLGVRSIPDVRVYAGGKKVDAFVGALGEEQLRARLSRHHAALPALPALPEPVAGSGESTGDAGGGEKRSGTIVPMEKDWTPPGMERR